jgi:hypothetical protein
VSWGELERSAPELGRLGRERIEAAGVGLLGTIRRDGSPRISPVEPHVAAGHLLLGLMAGTAKARDLARDPRCVLHTVVDEPDSGVPEFKVYGRVVDVGPSLRDAAPRAWWVARPPEQARVVSVEVAEAVYVAWDIRGGVMTVTRWSPRVGVRERSRPYP